MTVVVPESADRTNQSNVQDRIVFGKSSQRGTNVGDVRLLPCHPIDGQRVLKLYSSLDEVKNVERMSACDRLELSSRDELIQSEFADSFEHAEPQTAIG